MFTLDAHTRDAAGAFFVNELERLDPKLYMPLVDITWSRDIRLRTDVTVADEASSYIMSTFGTVGGLKPTGKNWLAPETTAIPGIRVNGSKLTAPLRPWALELAYDVIELARSQKLNRPLDVQQFNGLNLKYQMDVDEQVYIGDPELEAYGLLNSPRVTAISAGAKAAGGTAWSNATPDEILADVDALLTASWSASGYAVCPSKLLLPPVQFAQAVSKKVSEAGNVSVLKYIRENSIANEKNGRPLDIQPVKWAAGAGAGGLNRAMAYTDEEDRVRFPLVPIIRSNPYYAGLRWASVYYAILGEVEFVYPETVMYMDGM